MAVNNANLNLPGSAESVKLLINAVMLLANKDEAVVAVKYSAGIGVITGIGGVLGGGLLTPLGLTTVGIIAGAGIGSVASSFFFHKKFKPIVTIIDEMSETEKKELAGLVMKAVSKFNITDVYKLITLLEGKDGAVKLVVMQVIMDHIQAINN